MPINVTLLFSAEQYQSAADAYLRGIERRVAAGLTPVVASVASVFVSRWDKAVVDRAPGHLQDRLGIAVASGAYHAHRKLLASPRWGRLANEGARPPRLLWASTSTKNPAARDVLYISALAAPFTINTMPEATLLAFADHGPVEGLMLDSDRGARQTLASFAEVGIDRQVLAEQLQRGGAESFVQSWVDLLARIASKHERLTG